MKKLLTLLMALSMTLSLAACGGSKTPAEAPAEAPASDAAFTGVEDGVLTVGMECAYAPYNWTQTDDSNDAVPISNVPGAYANGYDVMIAKKICEANGWELEIVSSAWDSLCPAVSWVVWRAVGVGCAGVLRFHTVAVSVERVYKLVECGAVIAVRGVAHALECRAERYRRHRERTALRCR